MTTPTPTSIAQQLLQFGDSYTNILNELNGSTSVTQIQSDMSNLLTSIRNYMASVQGYVSENPQENSVLQAFSNSMLGLANADADLSNINKTQAIKDAETAQSDNQQVFSTMVQAAVQNGLQAWQTFYQNPTLANAQNAQSVIFQIDNFLYQQIGLRGADAMAGAIGISTDDLAKLVTYPEGGGFCAQTWYNLSNVIVPGYEQNPNYVPDPQMMQQMQTAAQAAATVAWPA